MPESTMNTKPADAVSGQPHKRVFVLDDDDDFRTDLCEFIAMAGHEVGSAGDARGLNEADLRRSDVLLLDLSLPGIDGAEFLRHLASQPDMPDVILMSGSGEDVLQAVADAARLRHARVLGSLKKPFDPDALLQLLEVVQSKTARRDAIGHTPIEQVLPVLAVAITTHRLAVGFQPKAYSDTLSFAGAEVLLADSLPELGRVSPQDIVAASRLQPGLLEALTQEVLRLGVEGCRTWRDAGWAGRVSVNLPLQALLAPSAVAALAAVTREGGLEPADVIFELAEDDLYISSSDALLALAQIRMAGFGLALDDVGQRNSGLVQLAKLPVTVIKIDMELLRQARTLPKARDIFASIAELGHRLGLLVVAEGVETTADLKFVRDNRVDLVQGYLVSRKLELSGLMALLASWPETTRR